MLIVGLGNPGRKFKKTWHNLGFLVLDQFRKENNFPYFKLSKKLKSQISEKEFKRKKIILAKPQTFMNNSGKALKELISYYQLPLVKLIVVHDELDLPLGKIKISQNRGPGGHKGVASIIEEIGSKNFSRVRIGIKPEEKIARKKDYLLKTFSLEKEQILKKIFKETTKILTQLAKIR